MAGTLIVVDQGDTFAVVGPDDSVLAHLSSPRLPERLPAQLRDVGDRLLLRLATTARAPGHPGADMASSRVGRLDAFDGDGRAVALFSVHGRLSRGPTGPDGDPGAVLDRLHRVIAHVNAEATRQNPRRTQADETLISSYLEHGGLPITAPQTLSEAVNLLYDGRYADPVGAGERLLRRTPLAGLVSAAGSAVGSLRPGRPRLPDLPPIGDPPGDPTTTVPHRRGWFHNVWHAATGTS